MAKMYQNAQPNCQRVESLSHKIQPNRSYSEVVDLTKADCHAIRLRSGSIDYFREGR